MAQQKKTLPFAVVAVCLFVSAASVFAGATPISAAGDREPRAADRPRGVRSYGPGAERVARPVLETVGRAGGTPRAVGNATRISGTPMVGAVNAFALTPNGLTAVYIADQAVAGLFELYSVPVNGSAAATKISAGLSFGAGAEGVASFRITRDGTRVAFLADAALGGGTNDVYSVPVNGSASPVRLSATGQAPVTALGIAPNSTTVAFLGSAGGGPVEVYRATLGSASSGVRLSSAGTGNVVFADFSPNSATLLFAADSASAGVFQWYSVPLSASGPGFSVRESNAISFVSLGAITPDSSKLVYTADQTSVFVMDLYSVPLGGGSATKLTPSMAGNGVTALRISADGQRVAYLADQVTADVVEVFGARPGIASSGVRLNTPLSGIQSADVVTFGPDNMTVLYEADENAVGTYDLMSAPADAAAAPVTLDALTVPRSAGYFSGLGTPVIGRRALYPVIASGVTDVFSVRYDGTGGLTRVNDILVAGESLLDAFVPNAATRLMGYGVGSAGVTKKLYAGPIRSDLAPEQVNTTAVAGSFGVLGYEITADESRVVYLQDQGTSGKPELYAYELDSDQDTVGNATDNCPFLANSGQGLVRFNQTVLAVDDQTFAWTGERDIRYVRGPLASVATLAVDVSGTLVEVDSFTDTSTPVSGAGYYYLFAQDCVGRSYQTTFGAEPNRDTAGLP